MTGTRDYLLLGLGSLGVLLLLLFVLGLGMYSVVPAGLGVLGLLLRWRLGPPLVLLALIAPTGWKWLVRLMADLLGSIDPVWSRSVTRRWMVVDFLDQLEASNPFSLQTLLLSAAVLGYVVAHYRLQGLTNHLLPVDAKPPRPAASSQQTRAAATARPERVRHQRSSHLVTGVEVIGVLITLPVCAVLAQLLWYGLFRQEETVGGYVVLWRAMKLVCVLVVPLLVVSGILRHLGDRHMTTEEAAVFLQDTVWHETRREQGRIAQWLTWARLRQRRKG